jgi:hypothetical protein
MTETLFHEIYQICTEAHNGAFIPQMAAQLIADQTGLAVSTIHAELTRPAIFFYDDVLPTLDHLFALPHVTPIIWTEGELSDASGGPGYQNLKVEAARLFERYPEWIDRAAHLGLPPIIGGFTKSQALTPLRLIVHRHGVGGVTVVDDKAEQLVTAHAFLASFVPALQLLQICRGDDPAASAATDDHPFIRRLAHLTDLIRLIPDRGRQPTAAVELILLDLDYTLIDHARTRQEMAERLERLISNE